MLELWNMLQEGLCFIHLFWFKIVLWWPLNSGASIHSNGVLLRGTWKKFQNIVKTFSICVLPDFGEIREQGQLIYFSLMSYPLGQDLIGSLNTVVSSTSERHAISSSLSLFCPKLCVKELRQVTGYYLSIYFVGCQLKKSIKFSQACLII